MTKVMIDIGHGGEDPGAVAHGLKEKDINLKVGQLLYDYLSKYDVELRMTRDKDITLSNDERVQIVKDFNPDLCVSVHHNAAANSEARGAEIIHTHNDQKDDKLATAILDNLATIGMPKRRIFTKLNAQGNDWYFMIRRIWDADTAAIIVEGGFVTNPNDATMLKKDAFLMSESAAIGAAIVDYLKLKAKAANLVDAALERIKAEGLIQESHNGTDVVTWGEFALVLSNLLDKEEK